jgi:hypothetical protein
MSQFNWQQDAEDHWEEIVPYTPEPKPGPQRRRWWLVCLILLPLALAGWLVYRQANQRVAETTAVLTSDVLSSHNLLLQAIYNKDSDLFIALLSGRDAQWTATQEAMLPAGTFLNRPSFGLYAAFVREPDLTTTENRLISLDFAPDLLSAELILSQPYTYTLPDGRTQTTTLQHTAVYRLGSQRWLYAPPEADFWGGTHNHDRSQLIVVYPERDEELAQRLAGDLEQLLNQLCRTLDDINCPDDMVVTLVLSPDPEILVNLTHAQTLWESGLRVVLPTPTLVGLPVDDAGYEALLRGYSTQVAAAVITHLVAWECCDGAPFYQALLDYQLSQLNLRPWPVTQADYRRVYDEEILLRTIVPYWQADNLPAVDPDDRWLIYTVADFLLQSGTANSPVIAQRSLNDWPSPLSWLESLVLAQPNPTLGTSNLLSKWLVTAAIRSQLSTDPAPVALPAQDLQLVCNNSRFDQESVILYRYELATGQWTDEYTSAGPLLMNPLPDDSTLIILQDFSETSIGITVWQNGQPIQTIRSGETSLFSFGHLYPTGQILAYAVDQSGGMFVPQLIDLTQCQNDACSVEARPGLLAWSPDGRQTIIADPFLSFLNTLPVNDRTFLISDTLNDQEPYTLFRTQGDERIAIGSGYAPFWIDNETYGYLQPADSGNLEIVVAQTADDLPQIITSSDTLRSLLNNDGTFTATFHINYVRPDPHNRERLFVVATSGDMTSPRIIYIFSINWQARRLSLLVTNNYSGGHMLDFSPDGRWLATGSWENRAGSELISLNSLYLTDLEQHHTQSFVTTFPAFSPAYLHDWSADGQWLAMLADDKIALALPGTDHYQIIQHDHGPCLSLAWINQKE